MRSGYCCVAERCRECSTVQCAIAVSCGREITAMTLAARVADVRETSGGEGNGEREELVVKGREGSCAPYAMLCAGCCVCLCCRISLVSFAVFSSTLLLLLLLPTYLPALKQLPESGTATALTPHSSWSCRLLVSASPTHTENLIARWTANPAIAGRIPIPHNVSLALDRTSFKPLIAVQTYWCHTTIPHFPHAFITSTLHTIPLQQSHNLSPELIAVL